MQTSYIYLASLSPLFVDTLRHCIKRADYSIQIMEDDGRYECSGNRVDEEKFDLSEKNLSYCYKNKDLRPIAQKPMKKAFTQLGKSGMPYSLSCSEGTLYRVTRFYYFVRC